MKKCLMWGTGNNSGFTYGMINKDICQVIAMIDENPDIWGMYWDGIFEIISPSDIKNYEYDYIVFSDVEYEGAFQKCLELGIEREKLIPFWKDSHDVVFENRSKRIELLENILALREANAPYEYGNAKKPQMRSGQELLRKIINDHSSLARFGDGEFAMIKMQDRPWFQKTDRGLSIRLWQVLHASTDLINIGLANMFGSLSQYKDHEADVKRSYIVSSRKDIYELLDFSKVYYDANVTRPYIEYKEPDNAEVIFSLWKELFKSRKILIVEGSRARNGINNDLFESASEIRRGLCPTRNAWSKYEEIYRNIIEKCDKDWLICISLGPTATVLSYDLALAGYQAIDMGQLDNEYDWFVRGASKREDIFGKQVSEVHYEILGEALKSDLFSSQILFDCSGE